jgi:multidrug transporter EmrE-like cation transporter
MTLPLAVLSLVCSVAFYAGGEYFSKLWGLAPSATLMSAAVVCYVISVFLWFPALLYRDQLSTIGIDWEILALCATLLLGFFVFHEVLSTRNWIGLVLALIAAWLLLT